MRVVPTDEGGGDLDLKGHTLVLPGCGSLAHLGELAVDALISTFELRRVGVALSRHILPVAMASAWDAPGVSSGGITTVAEIYQGSKAPGVSVLQVRAAIISGRRKVVAMELMAWARERGVKELFVVSSCSSHVKVDADLDASTDLRYVHVGGGETGLGPEIPPLGTGGHGEGGEEEEEGEEVKEKEVVDEASACDRLRGGGLARTLLQLAAEEGGAAPGSEAGEKFQPPPRAGGPSVLCLLGLTGEILDFRLLEQIALAATGRLARQLEAGKAPAGLRPPTSWRIAMEAEPRVEPRLWA